MRPLGGRKEAGWGGRGCWEHGAHMWAPTRPLPADPAALGPGLCGVCIRWRSGHQPGSHAPLSTWPCRNQLLAVARDPVTLPREVSHMSCRGQGLALRPSRGCRLTRCLQGSLTLGDAGEGGRWAQLARLPGDGEEQHVAQGKGKYLRWKGPDTIRPARHCPPLWSVSLQATGFMSCQSGVVQSPPSCPYTVMCARSHFWEAPWLFGGVQVPRRPQASCHSRGPGRASWGQGCPCLQVSMTWRRQPSCSRYSWGLQGPGPNCCWPSPRSPVLQMAVGARVLCREGGPWVVPSPPPVPPLSVPLPRSCP